MMNFRPSIVLSASGTKEEFWENSVNVLLINGISFRRVRGCVRCKIPSYDMEKKEFRKDKEPLRTLSEICYDDELEGTIFGQNFAVDVDGTDLSKVIHVGDEVLIIS